MSKNRHAHPTREAHELITTWPTGPAWATESDLFEILREDLDLRVGADGFTYGPGRPFRSVLNECRRRSWLIRDNRHTPALWKRTPTGAKVPDVCDSCRQYPCQPACDATTGGV